MNYRKLLSVGLMVLGVFFMSVPLCHAHRVIIFAWIEGDTVHTVSKFPGGNKAVDSTVAVYDEGGNRLLEGKTDDRGNFSFPIPEKPTALKIVLEAGPGHQGEWTLSKKEVAAALGETERPTPDAGTEGASGPVSEKAVSASEAPDTEAGAAPVAGISPNQLEAIVDRALDKKLQPIMNMLADMHDPGPSLTDIFGGIGYILGLFGVAALVMARNPKNSGKRR